ncbi:MAG: methyl-accepting chemotaxis protein [Cyanobacteria bacterium J06641_5]
MAAGIRQDNYDRDYRQAEKAYIDGNYDEALTIIDRLAREIPDDPSVLLLRGHVYCCFERYQEAREQYELVLKVTDEQDFINYAHKGIDSINHWDNRSQPDAHTTMDGFEATSPGEEEEVTLGTGLLDDASEGLTGALEGEEDLDLDAELRKSYSDSDDTQATEAYFANPFSEDVQETAGVLSETAGDLDDNDYTFDDSGLLAGIVAAPGDADGVATFDTSLDLSGDLAPERASNENDVTIDPSDGYSANGSAQATDPPTFLMSPDDLDDTFGHSAAEYIDDESMDEDSGSLTFDDPDRSPESWNDSIARLPSIADLEGEDSDSMSDLGLGATADVGEGPVLTAGLEVGDNSDAFSLGGDGADAAPIVDELNVGTTGAELVPIGGPFQALANAPLPQKQLFLAATTTIFGLIAGTAVGMAAIPQAESGLPKPLRAGAIGLAAGAFSGGAAFVTSGIIRRQVQRSIGDLQAQFYAIEQGDLGARASTLARDEFGQLSSEFNKAIGVMATLTAEAQSRAEEQEQAKEELQRQVIRLLDDVEGAARGDLTVQAEVSADVLGAVADAFNLTIRNLRTIVQQVKDAAREVNISSAESETFARGLSEDALHQAEELAVTLNSVQMMTDSIQRVAENALEAESVAQSASETALKGGEAVDSAVAGILQIRETVAQTARKVKRLAESSQEISKIVSAISQIASRTNLLALNASIEAARAGEAGRGFAVIADEVRQLADRSAKSLKEIEKIVLQIQGETSSVMAAMEEGTQQVIDGTQRAEQAKRALEDIIQVSNRIDTIVRSITTDTQDQTETSRSVAQVMQSVEMTAQGTSQESQQVSGALQHLTSLAGDLLSSVERFRVEPEERN